jgi:hypothetical protein
LSVADSDVQYALGGARLAGDCPPQLGEQVAIRLACWRATSLPITGPRQRDAVGTLKTVGRNGEAVIVREYGRPTTVISHQGVTTVADFEYVSPQVALALFLPMRLYLSLWLLDRGGRGTSDLLARLQTDVAVARRPTDRACRSLAVDPIHRANLSLGRKPNALAFAAVGAFLENHLVENGLQRLPVLADALPLLIHNKSKPNLDMAIGADLLKADRIRPVEAA